MVHFVDDYAFKAEFSVVEEKLANSQLGNSLNMKGVSLLSPAISSSLSNSCLPPSQICDDVQFGHCLTGQSPDRSKVQQDMCMAFFSPAPWALAVHLS